MPLCRLEAYLSCMWDPNIGTFIIHANVEIFSQRPSFISYFATFRSLLHYYTISAGGVCLLEDLYCYPVGS